MTDERSVPWQNKTIMVAAVIIAVVVVVLNYLYIGSVERKTEDQMVTVYKTKKTIEPGRPITRDDIEETRVPAPSDIDERPFVRAGEKDEFPSVREQPVRRRVNKGEPLRWDMFTDSTGGGQSADAAIRSDFRAFAMDVDPRHGTSLIAPGSKVDLFVQLQLPGADGNPLPVEVVPLLEHVEVFAVGSVWRPEEYRTGQASNYTRLVLHVRKDMIADLATILKLVPPPIAVLRNPGDRSLGELSAPNKLAELKKKAQTQKLPPDRLQPPATGF